jgi:AraC-like DNA-binding protein
MTLSAQDFSSESLIKMEDEELLSLFDEVETDSIKAGIVARVYLNRAKNNKDTIKMARGYDRLARIYHFEKNLQFADSIIYLTKDIDNITYPGLGYILKGYEYYKNKNYNQETKYYLIAYDFAVKNNNISQKLFLSNRLLYHKAIWGNKRDALKLQEERHQILNSEEYFSNIKKATRKELHKEIDMYYVKDRLASLQNFVFCYLNLKVLDTAKIYLKQGLELSIENIDKIGAKFYLEWFQESSIEIDFYNNKYQSAINSCDSLMQKINIKDNYRTLQNIYLFKGLSLMKLNEYEKGIAFLKDSDSIFEANNISITQPYQRILFEKLLEYYELKDNTKQKINYLNKLITTDSIIIKNYKFFEPNLIREFETPELIKEKELLIANLEQNNFKKSIQINIVIGSLSLCLFILGYYVNRQKVYKKRFNSILNQVETKRNTKIVEQARKEISKEIFNSILEHLDAFELEKKYLSTQISLQGMAKSFGTNYNYLSRVININKGKRFSTYINDLRVEYAFKELKTNSMLRNYTIKAIAKECGFKSAESFSKSFIKKFKFSPSFYLKQLAKSK